LNYLEIFEIIRADQGLSFSDVTFANFTGLTLDLVLSAPYGSRRLVHPPVWSEGRAGTGAGDAAAGSAALTPGRRADVDRNSRAVKFARV
jgi:hypothetical protein